MAQWHKGRRAIILQVLTAVLLLPAASAQSGKNPFYLETKIHAGINLPFYDAVSFMMKDDIYAFDISGGFPSSGKSYWERIYNYPSAGAGFSYWTLGNDDVFGRAYALYSFINVPLLKKHDRFSLDGQISAGGGYLTKRFDLERNYLNRAIGSHLNIYIRLGIDARIKLTPRSNLILEAGTSHFSNGKTKSPNRGLNFASVSMGINYLLLADDGQAIQEPEIPVYESRFYQSVALSAGSKVFDNLLNRKYLVSSLYYNIERSISLKSRIGVGAALFYDGSINEAISEEEGTNEEALSNLIRFGLHGSYSTRYKHMILGIQAGYYLYSKYTDLTRIYTRFSVQYLINEHIACFTGIKTHYGKADFLEFGLMYYW